VQTFDLYGLRIRSEIGLGTPTSRRGPVDITVRWGKTFAYAIPPSTTPPLATLSLGNRTGYTHVRGGSGYTLHFHDLCCLCVAADRSSIRVHLAPGANRDIVPLVLGGNALAFLLTLRGECVLHASAVELSGTAVAFLGGSGNGKSTLAALLCDGRARPVTDDLLRVTSETVIRCYRGPPEIRLRPNAAAIAQRFPDWGQPSADGRVVVRPSQRPPRERAGLPRLGAIIIPHPSRTCRRLTLRRLGAAEALYALLCHPRVGGLRDAELQRHHFQHSTRLVHRVPVYDAHIPWGPPFDPDLAATIERQLALS